MVANENPGVWGVAARLPKKPGTQKLTPPSSASEVCGPIARSAAARPQPANVEQIAERFPMSASLVSGHASANYKGKALNFAWGHPSAPESVWFVAFPTQVMPRNRHACGVGPGGQGIPQRPFRRIPDGAEKVRAKQSVNHPPWSFSHDER